MTECIEIGLKLFKLPEQNISGKLYIRSKLLGQPFGIQSDLDK